MSTPPSDKKERGEGDGAHLDLFHVGDPGASFGQSLFEGLDVGQQGGDVFGFLDDGCQGGRGVFLPGGGWELRGGGENPPRSRTQIPNVALLTPGVEAGEPQTL